MPLPPPSPLSRLGASLSAGSLPPPAQAERVLDSSERSAALRQRLVALMLKEKAWERALEASGPLCVGLGGEGAAAATTTTTSALGTRERKLAVSGGVARARSLAGLGRDAEALGALRDVDGFLRAHGAGMDAVTRESAARALFEACQVPLTQGAIKMEARILGLRVAREAALPFPAGRDALDKNVVQLIAVLAGRSSPPPDADQVTELELALGAATQPPPRDAFFDLGRLMHALPERRTRGLELMRESATTFAQWSRLGWLVMSSDVCEGLACYRRALYAYTGGSLPDPALTSLVEGYAKALVKTASPATDENAPPPPSSRKQAIAQAPPSIVIPPDPGATIPACSEVALLAALRVEFRSLCRLKALDVAQALMRNVASCSALPPAVHDLALANSLRAGRMQGRASQALEESVSSLLPSMALASTWAGVLRVEAAPNDAVALTEARKAAEALLRRGLGDEDDLAPLLDWFALMEWHELAREETATKDAMLNDFRALRDQLASLTQRGDSWSWRGQCQRAEYYYHKALALCVERGVSSSGVHGRLLLLQGMSDGRTKVPATPSIDGPVLGVLLDDRARLTYDLNQAEGYLYRRRFLTRWFECRLMTRAFHDSLQKLSVFHSPSANHSQRAQCLVTRADEALFVRQDVATAVVTYEESLHVLPARNPDPHVGPGMDLFSRSRLHMAYALGRSGKWASAEALLEDVVRHELGREATATAVADEDSSRPHLVTLQSACAALAVARSMMARTDEDVQAFLVHSSIGLRVREERAKKAEVDKALFSWHQSASSGEHPSALQRAAMETFRVQFFAKHAVAPLVTMVALALVPDLGNVLVLTRYDVAPHAVYTTSCTCGGGGGGGAGGVDDLISEFRDVMRINQETTSGATPETAREWKSDKKQAWWDTRHDLEARLGRLLDRVEREWLGWRANAFLGERRFLMPDHVWARTFLPQLKGLSSSAAGVVRLVLETTHMVLEEKEEEDNNETTGDQLTATLCEMGVALETIPKLLDLARTERKKAGRTKSGTKTAAAAAAAAIPMVLIPSRGLGDLPWECMPVLRQQRVSRVLSLPFALEANPVLTCSSPSPESGDGAFLVDPQNNLPRTVEAMKAITTRLRKERGWAKTAAAQDMLRDLTSHRHFLYCGHGGGEEFASGEDIASLSSPCRAVVMLMGCSSGKRTWAGAFEPHGVVDAYAVAGSPLVIANLWDVTDKDLDKFTVAMLEDGMFTSSAPGTSRATWAEVVQRARSACSLKLIVGAAPVCYGVPWLRPSPKSN